jgi:acyl-coenzyme A synthetase/AMP-(fatty) acid ligase
MIAAGKANHFAEPTWKYKKATTILRMLSRYGAHSFFTMPPVF